MRGVKGSILFLRRLTIPLTAAAKVSPAAPAWRHALLGNVGLCIGVAAVLPMLASRWKQPSIIAYLAAGVLIGPKIGLQWITDRHTIKVVSEVRLIVLPFMIGLEIDQGAPAPAGAAFVPEDQGHCDHRGHPTGTGSLSSRC